MVVKDNSLNIYTFRNEALGRGEVIYPFGYSVEAQDESDGVGIVEHNNAI